MISLTEQMVMREPECAAHPLATKGWRCYRIEYGFECGCPEGLVWLPPDIDQERVEEFLNGLLPPDREYWNMT